MKIGVDFHGVIDLYPELFSKLTKKWQEKGYEVHIVTGKEWKGAHEKLIKFNISYSKYYSIVDYHQSIGTPMKKKKNGWWMPEDTWDNSKGEYCKKTGITIHFDNDIQYAKAFPDNCTFVWVRKKSFDDFIKLLQVL